MPAPTAQHFAPIMFHGPMDPQQCPKISGNAVVCIVTTEHLIEMIHLFLQAESTQPLGKCFLHTEGVRAILKTQQEVVDISHHAGLALLSRLNHSLEPQIEKDGRDEP